MPIGFRPAPHRAWEISWYTLDVQAEDPLSRWPTQWSHVARGRLQQPAHRYLIDVVLARWHDGSWRVELQAELRGFGHQVVMTGRAQIGAAPARDQVQAILDQAIVEMLPIVEAKMEEDLATPDRPPAWRTRARGGAP